MVNTGFRIDIGKFKCTVISDGTLSPSAEPNKQPDTQNGDVDYLNCLLIDTGEHKILIDTGCGGGFQSTAGKLVQNLEDEGIKRSDITRIIFTHGHLDHAGGAFDAKGKPVFPNAHYFVSKKEWEYWATNQDKSELQTMLFASARRNLLPIRDQFDLVEQNVDALPGIKLIAASGHTPGNSMLEISSGDDRLLCVGDIIHSPKEFTAPECYALFDVVPEQAIRTRTQAISQAAKSGKLIFACHFPFPGLGYIQQAGNTLGWKPI
jgi:glyoxylase-like metal-dependent hydrolase (beta-lactamase superfamily II)